MANVITATADTFQISDTALRQLARGQNKNVLAALLGVKRFQVAQLDNGDVRTSFEFKGNRKMNVCWLSYNAGSDTYTLALVKMTKKIVSFKTVYQADGLYFDQLAGIFEEQTGLYVTF